MHSIISITSDVKKIGKKESTNQNTKFNNSVLVKQFAESLLIEKGRISFFSSRKKYNSQGCNAN